MRHGRNSTSNFIVTQISVCIESPFQICPTFGPTTRLCHKICSRAQLGIKGDTAQRKWERTGSSDSHMESEARMSQVHQDEISDAPGGNLWYDQNKCLWSPENSILNVLSAQCITESSLHILLQGAWSSFKVPAEHSFTILRTLEATSYRPTPCKSTESTTGKTREDIGI